MPSAFLETGNSNRNKTEVSTFVVGKYLFGLDVGRVQEVLRAQRMTEVPLAPPVIKGLINLRGQIVHALDMRWRLNLEQRANDTTAMNVVVKTEDGAVSLVVDDIGDVLELAPENIQPPPDNLAAEVSGMIKAVYKQEGPLLMLLDPEKILEVK